MSKRAIAIGLGLFAVIWLIIFISWYHFPANATFESDALEYAQTAVHLAQSGFYSLDGVHAYSVREPGYSVFLAGLFLLFGLMNPLAVFIAQGLLYVAACLTFCRELGRSFSTKIADLSFLLLILCIPVYRAIFSAYREAFTLCLFLFFAALTLSFLRRQSWTKAAGMGALLAYIILTYYSFVFFPLFLCAYLFWIKIPKKYLVTLLLIPIVVVGVWGYRNLMSTGSFRVIDPHRTAVMWYVRGEQAERVHGAEPLLCLWSEYISRNWSHRSSACSFNGLMHAKWPGNIPLSDDAQIGRAGQQKILAHFGWYLWFSGFEVVELHIPYVGGGWSHAYNLLAAISMLILYIGLMPLIRKKPDRIQGFFLLIIVYNTLVFVLTDATPRYLIPVIFCYAALSAAGYSRLLTRSS